MENRVTKIVTCLSYLSTKSTKYQKLWKEIRIVESKVKPSGSVLCLLATAPHK